MKKAVLTLGASLLLIALVYIIAPHTVKGSCREVKGKVSAVYGSAKESIYVRIAGFKYQFQLGSSANTDIKSLDLQKMLVGQDVKITYRDAWTPLDPSANKPIASLSLGDQVIYSDASVDTPY